MRAHLIEDIFDLILLDFLYMYPQTGPDLEDWVKKPKAVVGFLWLCHMCAYCMEQHEIQRSLCT